LAFPYPDRWGGTTLFKIPLAYSGRLTLDRSQGRPTRCSGSSAALAVTAPLISLLARMLLIAVSDPFRFEVERSCATFPWIFFSPYALDRLFESDSYGLAQTSRISIV